MRRALFLAATLLGSVGSVWACVPRRAVESPSCPCACASSSASTLATSPAPGASAPLPAAADPNDLLATASEKSAAGDGKGCLAALDAYDVVSKHPSTDPLTNAAQMRAHCLLLAGECQKGKAAYTKVFEARPKSFAGPEQRARAIEAIVFTTCRNTADLTPREQLLQAYWDLQQGAYVTEKPAAECASAYETVKKLRPWIAPQGDDDTQIKDGPKSLYHVAANCFARASDCPAAKKAFDEQYPQLPNTKDPKVLHEIMKSNFESLVPKCKGTY